MVKFRRSVKSDKDIKPQHISIPQKDAIAIVPPKKVIKALYDSPAYNTSTGAQYLDFSQGDFLHVVGREDDTEWYEACNPLQGSRGLVPVNFFQPVGKTVRDSGSSTQSAPSAGHDSGYAENPLSAGAAQNGSAQGMDMGPQPMRFSKSLAKGTGAMVYGVVVYDFKAERPDELEAKEGEAIIVIAQSNPEWFVAKPITRLGGPGLIPVSFIEIRDMATGKAVPDQEEAVRRANIPKVEEWKKMAADYKNGSIPLGRLETSPGGQQLTQGMERMSIGSNRQTADLNGYAIPHSRTPSAYQSQFRVSQQQQLKAPIRAAVPRYCFADDIFWFIVECEMEDGRHWELSRLYQDFYDLQISLISEFPVEAGHVKGVERSLPYMPGPVTYVTDNISNGRRANLDQYIKTLLNLGPQISQCYLIRRFFAPRQNDYEIDPEAAGQDAYRLSAASQHSSDPQSQNSRQSSAGNLPSTNPQQNPYGNNIYQHQRQQSSLSANHLGPGQQPPPLLRQTSAITQASASSAQSAQQQQAAIKIKVFFEQDNVVVIRMPPNFRYSQLLQKLRERRKLEISEEGRDEEDDVELMVDYRDEADGKYHPMESDEELAIALERNPKLTLSVRSAR